MKRYILNGSVLPDPGIYTYTEINEEKAKEVCRSGVISAVGHRSTAKLISEKLDTKIVPARRRINLKKNDEVLVFQLLQRIPEGKVISLEKLRKIPYRWGILRRIG